MKNVGFYLILAFLTFSAMIAYGTYSTSATQSGDELIESLEDNHTTRKQNSDVPIRTDKPKKKLERQAPFRNTPSLGMKKSSKPVYKRTGPVVSMTEEEKILIGVKHKLEHFKTLPQTDEVRSEISKLENFIRENE